MMNTYTHVSINKYYNSEVVFTTFYYEGDRATTDTVTDRSLFMITYFNVTANQIEGTFEFELISPYDLNITPEKSILSPIKIKNSYFKYINLKFYD